MVGVCGSWLAAPPGHGTSRFPRVEAMRSEADAMAAMTLTRRRCCADILGAEGELDARTVWGAALPWHAMSPVPAVLAAVGPGLSSVSAAVYATSSAPKGSALSRLKQPAVPVLFCAAVVWRATSWLLVWSLMWCRGCVADCCFSLCTLRCCPGLVVGCARSASLFLPHQSQAWCTHGVWRAGGG